MNAIDFLASPLRLIALSGAFLIAACGGGGGVGGGGTGAVAGGGSVSGSGTLRVLMTDAPACGFNNVFVTVEKVRVHSDTNADTNAPGWADITLNPAQRIDLLSLTNGVLATLGQAVLPAGTYQQIRLFWPRMGQGSPPIR